METVHQSVARAVGACGARVMFGVLGDANMLYVGDFIALGGTYVGAADERGCVMMAIGAAQLTGEVGVATVTHGPGITNAMTSLVEAARGRVPVVVLTGETPPVRDYVQAIDIGALVAGTGALYRRVLDPSHAFDDVCQAFRQAAAARLPVVLDIPYRLIWEEVEPEGLPPWLPQSQQVGPDEDAVDAALGVIASAARPVVLAGRGAATPEAREAVIAFADAIGAPLGTTLMGRNLFRDEPWDLGVLGTVGHEIAIETAGASDCVIAFGASLNKYTTSHGWLTTGRAVVHVDTDPERVGRFCSPTAAVVGDAQRVARRMTEQLLEADHRPAGFRSDRLRDQLAARRPRSEFTDTSSGDYIDARTAMIKLDEVLPRDRQLVTDVGRFVLAPWKYVHVEDPRRFAHTANFGSIGLGLGAAIGASVADGTRVTVAIVGDGGLMMGIAEISTAVRHRLPLVLVVVNDNCYGAEWAQLEKFGADPMLSLIQWPSFAAVAESMGAHALTVRCEDELDAVAGMIQAGDLPLVIDLRVDPAVAIGDVR